MPLTPTSSPTPDCEYLVVGSGAGGGTVAARLAEAGKHVILLEAGGDPRQAERRRSGAAHRQSSAPRLRRAGVPRLCLREQRHLVGLLRPPLPGRTAATPRPEVRRDARRVARRRHLLSACRHAGRLYRAQRDDPRLPAQRGLGPHRRADRRCELVVGGDAEVFRAARELRAPAGPSLAGEAGHQSDPPRVERLAALGNVHPARP